MERFSVLADLFDKLVRNTLVLIVVGGATFGFFRGLISPESFMGLVGTIIGLVLGAKAVQLGFQLGATNNNKEPSPPPPAAPRPPVPPPGGAG